MDLGKKIRTAQRSLSPCTVALSFVTKGDAWPLVGVGAYLKNNDPIELCKQLEKQMVCGEVSYQPRMESVPVIIPLPPAPDHGSIFTTQKTGGAKSAF